MVFPALELDDDKYQLRFRAKTVSGSVTLYAYMAYTSDDELDGEYVMRSQDPIESGTSVHNTNVTLANFHTAGNGHSVNTSWSTYTLTFTKPAAADWGSLIFWKNDADSVIFDWCSLRPAAKLLRPTASGFAADSAFTGTFATPAGALTHVTASSAWTTQAATIGGHTTSIASNVGNITLNTTGRGDYTNRFSTPTKVETYGKNELANGEFIQKNTTDTDNTNGRPAHFATTTGSGLSGARDGERCKYGENLVSSLPESSYSGYITDMDFRADNRIGYTDSDQDEIHIKSASALLAKGVPLEGGKKYRISLTAKMNDTSTTSYAYPTITNGPNCYRGNELAMQNAASNDSYGDTYISDSEITTGTWQQNGTSNAQFRHLRIGLYYITSEPGAGIQYIATQTQTESDIGTSTSANGEESTQITLTSTSFAEYTAVLTLPDDAIFGSFFIRRARMGKGRTRTGTYSISAVGHSGIFPVIKSVSLQKSSGIAVSSFVSLYNTLAGTSATITSTLRSNFNLSDQGLKENIQTLPNAMDKLMTLNPVVFNWKDFALRKETAESDFDESGENLIEPERMPNYGLIAQEASTVLPELVIENAYSFTEQFKDEELGTVESELIDYQGIDYNQLIPILIKGIQEQQEQIKTLKEEIETLSAKISDDETS